MEVVYSSASLKITDCTISGNIAKGIYGGGIYINSGSTIILTSVISANVAESSGGGIASSFGTQLIMTDCTIDANMALRYMGGGIFAAWDFSLTNCVVSNNTAGENGGGIFIALDMEQLRLDGTTFYGNTAKEGYYIVHADCEQHDRLITNTESLSEPFSVDAWVRHYAYNNYDIG